MHKSLSGLTLCPCPLGISSRRFSCVASQGAVWVPSHYWVGSGWGNLGLPWEQAAESCRCQSDSWKPGQVPAQPDVPTAIPFPQPWSPGWAGWGHPWQEQGCSHRCGTGRAGTTLDKASSPQKPGNGKSEPLASLAPEVKGLPAKPHPLVLSA